MWLELQFETVLLILQMSDLHWLNYSRQLKFNIPRVPSS